MSLGRWTEWRGKTGKMDGMEGEAGEKHGTEGEAGEMDQWLESFLDRNKTVNSDPQLAHKSKTW